MIYSERRSKKMIDLRLENVKGKLLEETQALKDKHRLKFDPNTQQGKYADNMGGNVIRTTGRALAGWMHGV